MSTKKGKFVKKVNAVAVCSGKIKVSCEIMLMCLGRNIRKLFTLLDAKKIKSNYWEKPINLKEEKFPFTKQKKN